MKLINTGISRGGEVRDAKQKTFLGGVWILSEITHFQITAFHVCYDKIKLPNIFSIIVVCHTFTVLDMS